jgi:hypothetical protein
LAQRKGDDARAQGAVVDRLIGVRGLVREQDAVGVDVEALELVAAPGEAQLRALPEAEEAVGLVSPPPVVVLHLLRGDDPGRGLLEADEPEQVVAVRDVVVLVAQRDEPLGPEGPQRARP